MKLKFVRASKSKKGRWMKFPQLSGPLGIIQFESVYLANYIKYVMYINCNVHKLLIVMLYTYMVIFKALCIYSWWWNRKRCLRIQDLVTVNLNYSLPERDNELVAIRHFAYKLHFFLSFSKVGSVRFSADFCGIDLPNSDWNGITSIWKSKWNMTSAHSFK